MLLCAMMMMMAGESVRGVLKYIRPAYVICVYLFGVFVEGCEAHIFRQIVGVFLVEIVVTRVYVECVY